MSSSGATFEAATDIQKPIASSSISSPVTAFVGGIDDFAPLSHPHSDTRHRADRFAKRLHELLAALGTFALDLKAYLLRQNVPLQWF